ncbi:PilN family type IVB pilus formation outer membrane protein [Pandoraea cepalis]|uniref:PilN family type IVB pilus formation outer membrane protein n=1 Tax=Pandoraea cepalis TaxID=2508294 RepID=A0AAW7MH04_9BURK|nr:PilN family type IVB pilus formation outer membrane protein [Pandoraea cepalis]MDN4572034.1 PilN family type IVB pilus formation outer membrane protein [Pandoraea cepalis]MDN4578880.1 PilN family type IVB pilus formation outer membrane protein [Pandoraea cepalis]
MKNTTRLAVATGAAALISGCSTFQNASQIEDATKADRSMIESAIRKGNPGGQDDTVQYIDRPYVSLAPILTKRRDETSSFKCHIGLATASAVSLQELAQLITRKCGTSVRITPDALQFLNGTLKTQKSNAAATTATVGAPAATIVPAIANRPAGVNVDNNLIDINFDGELDDLLAMVTARLGLSFAREKGSGSRPNYRIFAVETKTFRIHLLGGTLDMRSSFDSGTTQQTGATGQGTGSNATSSQGQSSTLSHVQSGVTGNLWDEMTKSLQAIGNVTTEPISGTVTVTDTVDVIDRVAQYVEAKNRIFDKFVTFQINVYSITTNSNDSLETNLNLVWQTLAGKGFSLANTASVPDGSVTGGYSVLNTSSSNFAGSKAMLSALNQIGSARLTRSTAIPALNLTMAATQTGDQDGFLASSQVSQTANVGSTASLQGGTITTGFNIALLPNVLEDNSMILRFQISLSKDKGPRTVESQGSKIELPNIGLPLNTAVTVPLDPGQTLMLSGQDYNDETSNRSGAGFAENFLTGGGLSATKSRTLLVVFITPILAEKSKYADQ